MHRLLNARVPLACLPNAFSERGHSPLEPWAGVDIQVDAGRITTITTAASPVDDGVPCPTSDLGGTIVFPGMLDSHTHLDKCHTWDRAPNPTGEFWDALSILRAESVNWSEDDTYRRAGFALCRAWAHGTVAIRTHLDVSVPATEATQTAIGRLRDEWAGRMEVQTIPLIPLAAFAGAEIDRIKNLVTRHRSTALGGFPQPNPDLATQLDSLLAAARELGIGIDLHIDESARMDAECLRAVAEAVLRNEFPHPVACGHCCSLALHEDERRRSTIALVKTAGLHIISLPMCNLYLQGRRRGPNGLPETPRWRGVTALHEWIDAGVTVACASDNVRDAFYAWGDLDLAEVFTQSVRIAHLDTRMSAAASVVTTGPARIMGLPSKGRVEIGRPAEFIVFEARTFNQLLAQPAPVRRFFRGDDWEKRPLPDYSELDS